MTNFFDKNKKNSLLLVKKDDFLYIDHQIHKVTEKYNGGIWVVNCQSDWSFAWSISPTYPFFIGKLEFCPIDCAINIFDLGPNGFIRHKHCHDSLGISKYSRSNWIYTSFDSQYQYQIYPGTYLSYQEMFNNWEVSFNGAIWIPAGMKKIIPLNEIGK